MSDEHVEGDGMDLVPQQTNNPLDLIEVNLNILRQSNVRLTSGGIVLSADMLEEVPQIREVAIPVLNIMNSTFGKLAEFFAIEIGDINLEDTLASGTARVRMTIDLKKVKLSFLILLVAMRKFQEQ